MNDKITLFTTGIFTVFFFISGMLDILDYFLVKIILIVIFLGIVVNIILVKTKVKKINLPPDSCRN
jgi:hypothetical protein